MCPGAVSTKIAVWTYRIRCTGTKSPDSAVILSELDHVAVRSTLKALCCRMRTHSTRGSHLHHPFGTQTANILAAPANSAKPTGGAATPRDAALVVTVPDPVELLLLPAPALTFSVMKLTADVPLSWT